MTLRTRTDIALATAVQPQLRTRQLVKPLEPVRSLQRSLSLAKELGKQLLVLELGKQLLVTAHQMTIR